VNGGTDSAFRFPDAAQHGLVAQHGDAHAFWFGAFGGTHVDDTEVSAEIIAATNISETTILPSISRFLTRLRPFVEAGVRFYGCNTTNAQFSTKKAQGTPLWNSKQIISREIQVVC
jgi:hypothetical protein